MPRQFPARFLLAALSVSSFWFAPGAVSQASSEHFDLHANVINVVTHEPISGALVRLSSV
jgi:hypothetical protein